MSNLISFKGDRWEYETFGNGNEPLLSFHGFDTHASSFKILEPSLGKIFKIFSFNLPFHGNSSPGNKELCYDRNDLYALFEEFIKEHSISRFSLMGYSLGGRIALQLIELFPDRIDTAILLAPAGILNTWENNFITNNILGKRVNQHIINDPSPLFALVKLLRSLGIISPKRYEFVVNQLSTREKRQLVSDVWKCFHRIKPDVANLQHILNKRKINVHLFFGKYDAIIPPAIGERFVSKLNDKSVLHIVEMGHNLLKEKMNDELSAILGTHSS